MRVRFFLGVDAMSFQYPGAAAPDIRPCRLAGSKLSFRGPARLPEAGSLACLGGTETYGRFLARPFPELLEARLGRSCVNMGVAHAGLDTFLNDRAALSIAGRADLVILQLPPAHALSNRFYRVHPRRNDRFLCATPVLEALYPELDFTEFAFVGALMARLRAACPERFGQVRDEVQTVWTRRMQLTLRGLRAPVLLLWLRRRAPSRQVEPAFVARRMVDALAPLSRGVVEVDVAPAGERGAFDGMFFEPLEASAAYSLPGPRAHEAVAAALAAAIGQ